MFPKDIIPYKTKGDSWVVVDVMIAHPCLQYPTDVPPGEVAICVKRAPGVFEWLTVKEFRAKFLKGDKS